MKTKIVFVLLMIVISGCYRPNWYRANTTYAQLKADSDWCKTQIKLGASRSEMIEQYEVCMKGKGYQLGGGQAEVGVKSPAETLDQRGGQTGVDQNAIVYVGITSFTVSKQPEHRYFHRKDCKHLSGVSHKR